MTDLISNPFFVKDLVRLGLNLWINITHSHFAKVIILLHVMEHNSRFPALGLFLRFKGVLQLATVVGLVRAKFKKAFLLLFCSVKTPQKLCPTIPIMHLIIIYYFTLLKHRKCDIILCSEWNYSTISLHSKYF